jgi:hypothetical protein
MKVFLSSTYNDLSDHRKAAHSAINPVDLTGFHAALIQRVDFVKPVRSGTQGWEK